jgi:hypothetical protein
MNDVIKSSLDAIARLQDWYLEECNGDWEHSYGITIETLDNPGWMVKIDLTDTFLQETQIESQIIQRNEQDWVQIEVTEACFRGCGGPKNLTELIELFFDLVVDAGRASEHDNPKT